MNLCLEGKWDLVTAGEALIDMISEEYVDDLGQADIFNRYMGGSPANIAVNVARQGFLVSMISRIGANMACSWTLRTKCP